MAAKPNLISAQPFTKSENIRLRETTNSRQSERFFRSQFLHKFYSFVDILMNHKNLNIQIAFGAVLLDNSMQLMIV